MSRTFPPTWIKTTIGALCNVGRGSSPRPIADQRYFEEGNIPWIKIADATKSGKYLYETKEKVNKFGASFSRLLPKGSLILAASGTLGYPQILGVDGCIHDGWLYLDNFCGVDKNYLYYFLINSRDYFYNAAYGAAIQNVNTMILREMEIYLPPLPTQQKIADILSAYDELIENNTRRIRILEEMAQAIYREWFVNFRFPWHEGVRMVESAAGRIPEGWRIGYFTDYIDVLSGGTPKTTNPEYWGTEIPWFTPQDLTGNYFILDTTRKITKIGLNKCNSKLYPRNAVFITARGTVGKCVLAAVSMAMSQTSYALIGKNGIPQYFVFLLAKNKVDYLKQQATGAVFDTIIVDTFRKLQVITPTPFILDQFHNIVVPIFLLIENLQKRNLNLRQQRDLLLPRLISGELDVEENNVN